MFFFDAKYVEISMNCIISEDYEQKLTQAGFTVLGKLPFTTGPVTFFPVLGVDFQFFLFGEGGDLTIKRDDLPGDKQDFYDDYSYCAGIGLDYNMSDKLYLRGEAIALMGFDVASKNGEEIVMRLFPSRVSIGVGARF